MTLRCRHCKSEDSVHYEATVRYAITDAGDPIKDPEAVGKGTYVCTECWGEDPDLDQLADKVSA